MIKRSALPKGLTTKFLGDTKLVRTLAGGLKTQEVVRLRDIRLPKFDKNKHINQQKNLVFDNDNVKYDIIQLSFQDWNKVELLRKKHGMHQKCKAR